MDFGLLIQNSESESIIPVEVFFSWKILGLLSDFKLTEYAGWPNQIYELVKEILPLNPKEKLIDILVI